MPNGTHPLKFNVFEKAKKSFWMFVDDFVEIIAEEVMPPSRCTISDM
jgi:hypothetical protein